MGPCSSLRKLGTSSRHPRASRVAGLFVVVLFSFLMLGAGNAAAKSWSYDLADELMSPYCPGRTLSSCPSPQAAELVQWMVVQEAGGATQEQVVEMLIERFGEEILGAPPAKGITLWAYIDGSLPRAPSAKRPPDIAKNRPARWSTMISRSSSTPTSRPAAELRP